MAPTTKLHAVKRKNRLSRSRDFDAVYRQGRSVVDPVPRPLLVPAGGGAREPRFGLSVPKAAGNSVERNRIKRQLREIWHERLARAPGGYDYVLIVRPGLPEAAEANGLRGSATAWTRCSSRRTWRPQSSGSVCRPTWGSGSSGLPL